MFSESAHCMKNLYDWVNVAVAKLDYNYKYHLIVIMMIILIQDVDKFCNSLAELYSNVSKVG